MRSESTRALGQPSETKLTVGARADVGAGSASAGVSAQRTLAKWAADGMEIGTGPSSSRLRA